MIHKKSVLIKSGDNKDCDDIGHLIQIGFSEFGTNQIIQKMGGHSKSDHLMP